MHRGPATAPGGPPAGPATPPTRSGGQKPASGFFLPWSWCSSGRVPRGGPRSPPPAQPSLRAVDRSAAFCKTSGRPPTLVGAPAGALCHLAGENRAQPFAGRQGCPTFLGGCKFAQGFVPTTTGCAPTQCGVARADSVSIDCTAARREPGALWTGPQIEEDIPRGQKLKKIKKPKILSVASGLLYSTIDSP
jgi:hypothetical protein